MKTMTCFFFKTLLAAVVLATSGLAQNADPLVYTVGKTFETNAGSTLHNYLLWQPGDAKTTFGLRFGIYCKSGNANSNNPYQRVGIQTLQTSPSAIQALLKLGAKFDADAAGLPELIIALHAESQSIILPDGYAFPSDFDLEVAKKLGEILAVATTDAQVLQSLVSLGRAHPGVQMCLGLGWSVEVQPNTLATYEIRELINNSDNDARVLGRVTLDSANPQMLVAPGRPVQMFHPNDPAYQSNASPKDHLTILTRWATPPTLRALLPHTYGYNLYRIEKSIIDNATINPATLASASDLLNLGGFRVNRLPAVASTLLTDTEAANAAHLPETFFYGDDNDAPDPGFKDGDTFYYYVAARDIAGHPGPLSPPTLITVCDRLPPSTPSIVTIDNVFDMSTADASAGTGQQHLRITIEQVAEEPAEHAATAYRIYRWHAATDWQRLGGDPEFNFIGEVRHVPGEAYVTFDDDDVSDIDTDGPGGQDPNNPLVGADTGAPVVTSESDAAMGKTYWYTVRAVDNSACEPKNYSGHCGAMYGVPRDRVGPEQPIGSIVNCFCIPRVRAIDKGVSVVSRKEYGLTESFPGFIVRVERLDPETRALVKKVKSVDVEYGSKANTREDQNAFLADFSTTRYYRGLETFTDIIIPNRDVDGRTLRVRARLGDGSVSAWYEISAVAEINKLGNITRYNLRAFVEICCPTLISSPALREKNGDIRDALRAFFPPFTSDPDCPPWIETTPGSIPPAHNPVGPDDSITGVSGYVYLDSGIREVRIYRRIEAGPLQMIARLSGESDLPSPYSWQELSPTLTNGVEACYYSQVFDEHANASPLTRIGCVTVVNEDLGVPILMDPVDLDPTGSQPAVKLSWFCDPVGIDRFELWVAAEGASDPSVSGIPSSTLSAPLDVITEPVLPDEDGNALTFTIYRTPSIASGFGDGGEFSLSLNVPVDKKLYYAIRPIGPQIPDAVTGDFEFATGDFSNLVSDKWVAPPAALQNVIPWPAKPLPGIAGIDLPVDKFVSGEGPYFAQPLQSSAMNQMGASALILMGVYPAISLSKEYTYEGEFPGDRDPLEWLFKYRRQPTQAVVSDDFEAVYPFVVYRYQVKSSAYPNAKPNLVQITPLIDRMAYRTLKTDPRRLGVEYSYLHVQDPFFLFQYYAQTWPIPLKVPLSGQFSRDPSTFGTGIPDSNNPAANPSYLQILGSNVPEDLALKFVRPSTIWIRDTQPVVLGASYQYLIVSFSQRGEIKRVIPTNTITHS